MGLHAWAWLGTLQNSAVDIFLGTSYIDQCIRHALTVERKIVPVDSRPVVILKSLSEFMSLFEEDVRDDAILYGSGNLGFFLCLVVRPITVQLYTQAPIMVTP